MTRWWTEDAIEAYYAKQRSRSGVVGTRTDNRQQLHRTKYAGQAPRGCAEPPPGIAGSNPASSSYKSKWEETFAYELVLRQRTGLIQKWGYEVMTLKLAKGKYARPDFTIWHLDGSIEQANVKGHHPNLRDSMTHLVWAAQQHPWFRFTIHRRSGGGWESSEVKP